jgi:hypothetical protein
LPAGHSPAESLSYLGVAESLSADTATPGRKAVLVLFRLTHPPSLESLEGCLRD